MDGNTIAQAAVELRIATRKACMTFLGERKKSTLSLETKVLFLIRDNPLTPNTLIDLLGVQKSNLASIAKSLEQRGLIVRKKLPARREIAYHITEGGLALLESTLSEIESAFKKFISDDKEYAEAVETLSSATRLLAFI